MPILDPIWDLPLGLLWPCNPPKQKQTSFLLRGHQSILLKSWDICIKHTLKINLRSFFLTYLTLPDLAKMFLFCQGNSPHNVRCPSDMELSAISFSSQLLLDVVPWSAPRGKEFIFQPSSLRGETASFREGILYFCLVWVGLGPGW